MGADPEHGVRHACNRGCHVPNARAVEREQIRLDVRQQLDDDWDDFVDYHFNSPWRWT